MAAQLKSMYGNITAENAIRNVTSIVQTGTLTAVYYDYSKESVYIANARGKNESGAEFAYDRLEKRFLKFIDIC
jgi:hypothetical protein